MAKVFFKTFSLLQKKISDSYVIALCNENFFMPKNLKNQTFWFLIITLDFFNLYRSEITIVTKYPVPKRNISKQGNLKVLICLQWNDETCKAYFIKFKWMQIRNFCINIFIVGSNSILGTDLASSSQKYRGLNTQGVQP